MIKCDIQYKVLTIYSYYIEYKYTFPELQLKIACCDKKWEHIEKRIKILTNKYRTSCNEETKENLKTLLEKKSIIIVLYV